MQVEQVRDGIRYLVIDHGSWLSLHHEMAKRVNSNPAPWRASTSESSADWAGTPTYGDAETLAIRGWQEGGKMVNERGKALFGELSELAYRFTNVYREYPGSRFNVGRVASGDPRHWVKRERKITRGVGQNIVHVVVNCGYAGGIPQQAIVSRGAMISILVKLMEVAGLNVEVTGVFVTADDLYKPKNVVEQYFTIKGSQYSVDENHLAMVLAHPSTFRRIGLATLEELPVKWKEIIGIPGGYGFTHEAANKGDIYVPTLEPRFAALWSDTAFTRKWVVELMKEQGLEEVLLS